jgi:hypothetical protein
MTSPSGGDAHPFERAAPALPEEGHDLGARQAEPLVDVRARERSRLMGLGLMDEVTVRRAGLEIEHDEPAAAADDLYDGRGGG